jgi:hypothetical protein
MFQDISFRKKAEKAQSRCPLSLTRLGIRRVQVFLKQGRKDACYLTAGRREQENV